MVRAQERGADGGGVVAGRLAVDDLGLLGGEGGGGGGLVMAGGGIR